MTARPDPDYADIIQKWKELAELATGIIPTKLPMHCEGNDFIAIVKDLEALVRAVDPLVLAYGDYVRNNACIEVDTVGFQDQLALSMEARSGAYNVIQDVADRVDEENAEAASEPDPDYLYDQWRDRQMEDAS
jgi:hypothetical protein